jgi:hypothetical protein
MKSFAKVQLFYHVGNPLKWLFIQMSNEKSKEDYVVKRSVGVLNQIKNGAPLLTHHHKISSL